MKVLNENFTIHSVLQNTDDSPERWKLLLTSLGHFSSILVSFFPMQLITKIIRMVDIKNRES